MTTTTYKQVGRNCLADFLGGIDAHAAASMAEILANVHYTAGACMDDDMGEGGPRAKFYHSNAHYLAWVAKDIRENGWLSKGKAWERDGDSGAATAVQAWNAMVDTQKEQHGIKDPTDADLKVAADTIAYCNEYFEAADSEKLSDYEHNLKVSLSTGIVEFKTAGMIASAVNFVVREQAKKNQTEWVNDFVGTLGERMTLTLTFVRRYVNGRCEFKTADGKKVTAFPKFDVVEGQVYVVDGTPTKQDEWKGNKSTYINRVAIHVEKVKKPRAKKEAK